MSDKIASHITVGTPLVSFAEDTEHFRMPHITTTSNTKTGEQIARATVNGKIYEARHPFDSGRAAQALGEKIAAENRAGQLVTGVIR